MVRHASVHVYGVRAGGVPEHWVRFACFLVVEKANIGWADLAAMETRFIFVCMAGNAHHSGDTAAKYLALDLVNWLLAVDKAKAPSMTRQIVTPNDQYVEHAMLR